MDLSKQTLFKMITERMSYLGLRQKVLSQNVANANTPNYQARDLKPLNFKDQLAREAHRVTPAITQANHLPPVTPSEPFEIQKQKRPYETTLDKNGVVLEEQAQKVAATQVDYQTTTALYRKYVAMFKLVMSR
ncbi:MAG: flagellar basal body rod protein FlgB [Proteobacteria bacterium]|nr:flagellar basal body rod protein FlgB [Pseudomonadota bacterium]